MRILRVFGVAGRGLAGFVMAAGLAAGLVVAANAANVAGAAGANLTANSANGTSVSAPAQPQIQPQNPPHSAWQNGYKIGGFVGDGGRTWSANSVRGALRADDGASALIVGSILRQLTHKTYEFSDGRHKIIVKIDYETWGGAEVSSHDLIEIYGRVRGRFGAANSLDVKSLRKLAD